MIAMIFCALDVTLPRMPRDQKRVLFTFLERDSILSRVDRTAQAVNQGVIWPQVHKISNAACNSLKQ